MGFRYRIRGSRGVVRRGCLLLMIRVRRGDRRRARGQRAKRSGKAQQAQRAGRYADNKVRAAADMLRANRAVPAVWIAE